MEPLLIAILFIAAIAVAAVFVFWLFNQFALQEPTKKMLNIGAAALVAVAVICVLVYIASKIPGMLR